MKEEFRSQEQEDLLSSRASKSKIQGKTLRSPFQLNNYQSAALVGLALSLGTTSIFWLYQQQQALATNLKLNIGNNSSLRANKSNDLPDDRSGVEQKPNIEIEEIEAIAREEVKTEAVSRESKVELPIKSDRLPSKNIAFKKLKEKQKQLFTALQHLKPQNPFSKVATSNFAKEQSTATKPTFFETSQTIKPNSLLISQSKSESALTKNDTSSTLLEKVAQRSPEIKPPIVIRSNLEAKSTTAIPELPPLTHSSSPSIKDTPKEIYTVRAGDTLDGIASRYGISRQRLVQENKLNNPDLILVNQQLKIPEIEQLNNSIIQFPQQGESIRFQTTEISLFPGVIKQSKPLTNEILAQTTPTIIVNQPQEQVDNTVVDPYISKLRADIIELREQYKSQNINTENNIRQESLQPNNFVTKNALEQRSSFSEAQPATPYVFRQVNNSDTELENQNLQRQKLPELPDFPSKSSLTPNNLQNTIPREDVISTIPTEIENYNQRLRIPIGETVSPELPPLNSPENYLPSNPAQFDGYIWPSKGVLTSGYGWRWGRMHRGIDIAGPVGTPIVAAASGEVISAGWNSGGYGNLVKLKHLDGSVTVYAHNNRVLVSSGQWVEQGETIAEMGSTGFSTGPHLHFEIRPNGEAAVNPIAYLPNQ